MYRTPRFSPACRILLFAPRDTLRSYTDRMPSYRVTLTIGDLRVGVHPDRVVAIIGGPASALTVLEGTNLNVVAGQARITIRFTADDDDHAAFVAREVIQAATAIADVRTAFVTRRAENTWSDVDVPHPVVADSAVPLVLRHGYTAAQMRAAELPHHEAGDPLMARAAAGLAVVIRDVVAGRRGGGLDGSAVVLVGPGNNGADALWAAAELSGDGVSVTAIPAAGAKGIDAGSRAAAVSAGVAFAALSEVAELAERSDVIVDGLFGIGAAGRASTALPADARDAVLAVLPALKSTRPPVVVAVDVPSGIDADSGEVPDADEDVHRPAILPADVTVTFGGMKAGLLRAPARRYAGQVVIVDIGLGEQLEALEPAIQLDPRR